MKKIIFSIILILFLIGSISAVSSAESTDAMESDIDETIDLSNVNDETQSIENANVNNNENLLGSSSDDGSLGQPDGAQQQHDDSQDSGNEKNFVVVTKNWEGNYSGDIEEIEIELLKKLNPNIDNPKVPEPCHPKVPEPCHPKVPEPCPSPVVPGPAQQQTKQKASLDDSNINQNILASAIGDIVILPDENGNLTSYVVVQKAKLTKANNWKHAFKNLTFASAYRDNEGQWVLYDAGEYMVREFTPDNTELISSHFVKYFTCPADNGLKVFWNLTNRVVPNETTNETTNKTPETNQTVNETDEDEFEFVEPGYGKGPGSPKNETPSESSEDSPAPSKVNVSKTATGNPIFLILIALFAMIIPTLRKRE
ncbi:hypothetical protein [uncultured Methanobrevibacter sp.]|uniref:hypothetical protein n=1 Tax=uncultured Methanobrevibacter sp. TaxID=253161 RepID=UPI0025F24B39|nr:hypothetical protein [uncultured Methanobrevibacter sp.]